MDRKELTKATGNNFQRKRLPFEKVKYYTSKTLGINSENLVKSFQPAQKKDISEVAQFRKLILNPEVPLCDDEKYLKWMYSNFSNGSNEGNTYWILRYNGEIIGGIGAEKFVLFIERKRYSGTRILDIMVHPKYDGRGLGAFMNMAIQEKCIVSTVIGTNLRSRNMTSRLFKRLSDMSSFKILIKTEPLFKKYLKSTFLSFPISFIVDPFMLLRIKVKQQRIPNGIIIRAIEQFDTRVNGISEQMVISGKFFVYRSDKYLNWRYCKNPRHQYKIHGAFKGETLLGYIVTRFNFQSNIKQKQGLIIDWFCTDQSVLYALIQTGIDFLIKSGVGLIICKAYGPSINKVFKSFGFIFRPDAGTPFFTHASSKELYENISEEERWFLTQGDFSEE